MSPAQAVAPGTGFLPDRISQAMPLPREAGAMDAAKFQQLLAQAQQDQGRVEFSNPAGSAAGPGMNMVLGGIRSSTDNYMGAVDNGLKSLSSLNLSDPKSIGNVVQHFTIAQIQSVQMTAVLSEVSNSKKSLQTLFQNQG